MSLEDTKQQAFQWAVSHPDFMESIVAIAGTAKTHPPYVPSSSDLYFPLSDAEYEARFLADVDSRPLRTIYGHMAGNALTEEDRGFLKRAIEAAMR